jgi:hypothetical protein
MAFETSEGPSGESFPSVFSISIILVGVDGSEALVEFDSLATWESSNYFLFRTTLTRKARKLPKIMKNISIAMKTSDFFCEPNPMIRVSRESEMKAQINDPPLSIPVTWAYPMGNASSQPSS